MSKNPLGMKRFGPVTLNVQNAQGEAERLSKLLGMDIAYIPEGNDQIFGLEAEDVLFILDGSPAAEALAKEYGNHVTELGIRVDSAQAALDAAKKKTSEPMRLCEKTGVAYLKAPHDGELYFRFIEDGQHPYLGMVRNPNLKPSGNYAFNRIDHIVTNTQKILPVIQFMQDVFGMQKVNEFTVRVEADDFMASLYSEVMGIYGSEEAILFPVNEPLAGDDVSQIPAQLREMKRSHAQHIALATDDIVHGIQSLRSRGMAFLEFRNEAHAKCYYEDVPNRLGNITVQEALTTLRELGILVDKCGEGYLLQLFSTRMFPDKSVPFVEIIQRASDVIGCFGDGNFAALAESLEYSMRHGGTSQP
ncbi:MAG: VOC family protein [Bdellovibrionales bacterium]|nr:VOC family protein [Bdellovibrionales bacterium]